MAVICTECKHSKQYGRSSMVYCVAPQLGHSLIDGEVKSLFAITVRNDNKRCGEIGRWWELKPEEKYVPEQKLGFWKKFRGILWWKNHG